MAPRGRPPKKPQQDSTRRIKDESLGEDGFDPSKNIVDSQLAGETKIFSGVVVPMKRSASRVSKLKRDSTSSLSSPAPSIADSVSTYETPGTSAPVTPAESVVIFKDKGKGRAKALRSLRSSDEVLAQTLQEEEYGIEHDESPQTSGGASKMRKTKSTLPGSSSLKNGKSRLAPIEADAEDSDEIPLMLQHKHKRVRLTKDAQDSMPPSPNDSGHLNARPQRRAGASAQEAIKLHSSELGEMSSGLSDAAISSMDDDFSDDLSEPEPDLSPAPSDESDPLPALIPQQSTRRSRGRSRTTRRTRDRRGRRFQGRTRAETERFKLEYHHPEIITMWQDLEAIPKIKTEQIKQPESITRQLKSFQLEGVNWMIKQEQTQWKGGLLGDEMGMGKTIQAVSLIMSDYPQKDPTLVVVPPVALMQWTNEITEYTNGKLKILLYHGTNSKVKGMSVKDLKKHDVIMISYSGLESIHRKQVKGWSRGDVLVKEDSPIHAIHFHRLILDEAHSIKSRTTGVAKACYALKGSYKWCLSGTPVQNRIAEFFSLMRFLEVTPFANYFCKQCTCSSMHWSMSANYRCTLCNHRALDHVSAFNQEIINPMTSSEADDNVRKAAFGKLRKLTDQIMLRRMKRDHTASMELPPKETVIHREFFGPEEQDFAASIMGDTTRKFDTYVSRGVMLNNYANIFGLIMQMRQVADHPDLLLKKHAPEGANVNVLVCNICDEAAEDAVRSQCKHEFCRTCVKEYVESCEGSGGVADCPRCHIALSIDLEQPEIEQDAEHVKTTSIINRIKMENWCSSTKIEMLVYDLWKQRNSKRTTKSIVFSQFTSMLQLIEWRLRRAGFNTVMLDGSMSPVQRQRSIEHFMNNTDCEVFLVSLKAGGVALNLVEASRVYVVDPWWNPAAEWQASDRCHRIGQRRPCVITRLCVEDSIESRIVMLQEKKAHMIHGTVNNDEVSMEKLTPQDMQFLFRG